MDCTVHGILQARILEWVAIPFSGDLSNLEIEPRSPTLQVDSLPAEPPGKTKNTGVGSLTLLQQIFPNQESNCGLWHCRQILYQLSYEGNILITLHKTSMSLRDNSTHLYKFIPNHFCPRNLLLGLPHVDRASMREPYEDHSLILRGLRAHHQHRSAHYQ